jgi:hypothetical protein
VSFQSWQGARNNAQTLKSYNNFEQNWDFHPGQIISGLVALQSDKANLCKWLQERRLWPEILHNRNHRGICDKNTELAYYYL